MLRNNISKEFNKIPKITITKSSILKNTMSIKFENSFSQTDLFLAMRSYSDSLTIATIQILIKVSETIDNKREFYSDSISSFELSNMSLYEFSKWYNNRWQIDCEYLSHNQFQHEFLIRTTSKEAFFPIYPWSENIIEEVLGQTIFDKDVKILKLENEIKLLKEKLKNKN